MIAIDPVFYQHLQQEMNSIFAVKMEDKKIVTQQDRSRSAPFDG